MTTPTVLMRFSCPHIGHQTGMTIPLLGADRVGAGEPLLLLHGLGSTRDDFAGLLPALQQHFDILSVDLPGHGTSPALASRPTIEALTEAVIADLDARGLDSVHVLGNSLGGRIAIELAKEHRALSVVAISPSGLGLPLERALQGTLMSTARLMNQARRPWIDELSRTVPGRTTLMAGLRAQPWRASRTESLAVRGGFADATGFWSMLWNAVLADLPTRLEQIDCPVIVAQGAFDVIGSGQTPRYTPVIRGSRFVLLPFAGHAPMSDSPETIVSLVRSAADEAAARELAPAA